MHRHHHLLPVLANGSLILVATGVIFLLWKGTFFIALLVTGCFSLHLFLDAVIQYQTYRGREGAKQLLRALLFLFLSIYLLIHFS